MIACQGNFVSDCTRIATNIVNFGGVDQLGMPEQGTEMNLCGPCTADFQSRNPEAIIVKLPDGGGSQIIREKGF